MARRKMEARPETVGCGNRECSRSNLSLRDYSHGSPGDHVPKERIHWCAYPRIDGQTVLCQCGHFTVFYNPAERTPPTN
jgi:hypothetical protein